MIMSKLTVDKTKSLTGSLKVFYDHHRSNSLAFNYRKKRLSFFKFLIVSIPGPLKILDVGGNQSMWKLSGFLDEEMRDIEITLLNINTKIVQEVTHPKIRGVVCDANNMQQFKNSEFDVVFSNAVIEHVGNYNDQMKMAREVMRVGKRYFVQTPNLYFPIESHFVFPFFQFFPLELKVWLITHFDLGWSKKTTDKQIAKKRANSIRLLSKRELMTLFPNANFYEEKFFGLTKSFIVYKGWETSSVETKR